MIDDKFYSIWLKGRWHKQLITEAIKKSAKEKRIISKPKLLEQILAERYDLKTLIKENEIPKE